MLINRLAARAFLVAAVCLAGCPGGGDGGGEAPGAPTALTAIQDPVEFNDVYVSWTPPPGEITSYEGEGRMGSGPWQALVDVTIPGDAVGLTLQTDDQVPELTEFTFRLRAVHGNARSAWSNEAAYTRGVRQPVLPTATTLREGIRLEWRNASAVATGVRIEVAQAGSSRLVAELAATATSFLDTTQLRAGEARYYRIHATHALTVSLPATCMSPGYPATPVSDLTATTETGGVRLRWTNPPIERVGFVVHQIGINSGSGTSNAVSRVLPPDTTEFLHPASPGIYRYEVETRLGQEGVANPRAAVLGVASPAGGANIVPTIVTLPTAVAAARNSRGVLGFAVGAAYGYPQRIVFSGIGAPPDHDLGPNNSWAEPGLMFDTGDHPHAMVIRPVVGSDGLRSLVHVWHDGVDWREEEVARRAFGDPGAPRFACDAVGRLHAAWSIGDTAEYARRGSSAWVIEAISSWPSSTALAAFTVDAAGIPHAVAEHRYTTEGGPVLLWQGIPWVAEAVPVVGMASRLVPLSSGIGLLQYHCVQRTFPEAPGGAADLLERKPSGWSPESVLFEQSYCLSPDVLGGAVNERGKWVAWIASTVDLQLRFRDAGSTSWSAADTGLADAAVLVSWFDDRGKVHLLARTQEFRYGKDVMSYVRYDEQ